MDALFFVHKYAILVHLKYEKEIKYNKRCHKRVEK